MPNNYDFIDAHGSILTGRSSVTSGSAQEPLVIISSVLFTIPTTFVGNPSISGTVINTNKAASFSLADDTNNSTHQLESDSGGTIRIAVAPFVFNGTNWDRQRGNSSIGALVNMGTGSVLTVQSGTRISSIVNSIPSSLLTGAYGHRNDAVASFLGGNLTWNPIATDSAGRVLSRPFAPEAARIEGYASTVNLNANSVIAAAGTGLRNYITDVWVANTGAANTLVTFLSGGGLSVLGYTIAPTVGGSNLIGLVTPMRTGAGETFDFRAATGTSVLYITAKGFTGP